MGKFCNSLKIKKSLFTYFWKDLTFKSLKSTSWKLKINFPRESQCDSHMIHFKSRIWYF